jgi:hypothetical protein
LNNLILNNLKAYNKLVKLPSSKITYNNLG